MLVPLLLDSFGVDIYEGAIGSGIGSDLGGVGKKASDAAAADKASQSQLPFNTAWINNIIRAKTNYDNYVNNLNTVNASVNKISDATLKTSVSNNINDVMTSYTLVLKGARDSYTSILKYNPEAKPTPPTPSATYTTFKTLIEGKTNEIQGKIKNIKTNLKTNTKAADKTTVDEIVNTLNANIFPTSIGEIWYVDDPNKPTKAVVKSPPFPGVDLPANDISNFLIYAKTMSTGVLYLSNNNKSGNKGGKDALNILKADPNLVWNK
jgi:hypothetical protein